MRVAAKAGHPCVPKLSCLNYDAVHLKRCSVPRMAPNRPAHKQVKSRQVVSITGGKALHILEFRNVRLLRRLTSTFSSSSDPSAGRFLSGPSLTGAATTDERLGRRLCSSSGGHGPSPGPGRTSCKPGI